MHFMGFHGAAIATLLSQAVCLVFMVIYLKRKRLFSLHITCFDKADVLPLVPKAIPSVIQQSIQAVSTTFLTALVSTYSIIEIAAYGIKTGNYTFLSGYGVEYGLNCNYRSVYRWTTGWLRKRLWTVAAREYHYPFCVVVARKLLHLLPGAVLVARSRQGEVMAHPPCLVLANRT